VAPSTRIAPPSTTAPSSLLEPAPEITPRPPKYGTFNQSGGTINSLSEYWLAENTGSIGTNNISGTALLN
jgi:hypothetical protein